MLSTILAADNLPFDSGIYSDIEGGIPGYKFYGASIGTVVSSIIPLAFFVAGVALLLYLISGGYSLMFSAGDPKKTAGAKSTITNALLGMLIVFVSFWAVQLIAILFGLPTVLSVFY